MRVVADTNVVVSAVIAGGKPRQVIDEAIQDEIELVLSPAIVEEIVNVLGRPKFELDEETVHRIVGALVQTATIIGVESSVRVVEEDPDDDAILDTALDARADVVVSGDSHLLELGAFEGIRIVGASELLEELRNR